MLHFSYPVCSVMDMNNLWNDDPEALFLELGFGSDEPDLSMRIPARFINSQSQANGINLQVFLEAQKSRLDLENPDVSSKSDKHNSGIWYWLYARIKHIQNYLHARLRYKLQILIVCTTTLHFD